MFHSSAQVSLEVEAKRKRENIHYGAQSQARLYPNRPVRRVMSRILPRQTTWESLQEGYWLGPISKGGGNRAE